MPRATIDYWPSLALFFIGVAIGVPTVQRWLAGETVDTSRWVIAGVAAAASVGVVLMWAARLWAHWRRP